MQIPERMHPRSLTFLFAPLAPLRRYIIMLLRYQLLQPFPPAAASLVLLACC